MLQIQRADGSSNKGRNPCGSCSTCIAEPNPTEGWPTNDGNCAKCANGGYAWWPCNTVLCKCGASDPTPISTPSPPSTPVSTPAPPSSTPAPSTVAGVCGTWAGICNSCPGGSSECMQCTSDPAKWQCGEEIPVPSSPTPNPPASTPNPPAPTPNPPSPTPNPTANSPTPIAPPQTPTPPTSTGGYCKPIADDADCSFTPGAGISAWFTQAMYDEMFPNMCATGCSGCGLLTYNCMVAATLLFPEIASSSDIEANKREIAGWLGIMSQETTGGGCMQPVQDIGGGQCQCSPTWCDGQPNGGCAAWGMCKIAEAGGTYCTSSSTWPCQEGRSYKGRGPKQLSYNYNYGQFSEEFCGDKMVLLENPDWVETNKLLAWTSAAWFWMTGGACNSAAGEICKPGVHEVFTGTKTMCPADIEAGRVHGLGWATNVVNGGLECGPEQDTCDYRVWSRVRFYEHFCDVLGVSPLTAGQTDDHLFCSTQRNYVQSPPTQC